MADESLERLRQRLSEYIDDVTRKESSKRESDPKMASSVAQLANALTRCVKQIEESDQSGPSASEMTQEQLELEMSRLRLPESATSYQ